MLVDWKINSVKMDILLKEICKLGTMPTNIPKTSFTKTGKKNQKIELFSKFKNLYRSTNVKTILSKKSRLEKSLCLISGYTAEPR